MQKKSIDITSNIVYEGKSVYIIHYQNSQNFQASFSLLNSLIDNNLNHYCNTGKGSSGSPILSLETCKVIGIHFGSAINEMNKSLFIQYAIDEFNKIYDKI